VAAQTMKANRRQQTNDYFISIGIMRKVNNESCCPV
jgi:hypothetical protein